VLQELQGKVKYMFYLKKETGLSYDNEVFKSADIVFKLQSEYNVNINGILVLSNGINITIPFQNEGAIYKGKFVVSKDVLPFLNQCSFYVYMSDLNMSQQSNSVQIVFDIPKITIGIKKEVGEEVKLLNVRVAELESQLIKLSTKGILKNAPVINKDEIKQGMVPIATATGEFTAAYPFANIVKNINGIGAINEAILLTLAEIPYEPNGRSTKEVVQLILEIVKGQAEVIQTILKTQEKIIQDIKDIKLDFAEHKNTALF
jgi:hypothetical protein